MHDDVDASELGSHLIYHASGIVDVAEVCTNRGGYAVGVANLFHERTRRTLEAALSESREKLVILRGDKSVMLGQAVNILDLAQQAGATGIALATKPPGKEKG